MSLITGAPILTTVAVLVLLTLGYRMARSQYKPAFDAKQATIDAKQATIDLYKAKLDVNSPDEAGEKIKALQKRIEEVANQPAKWS